MSASKNEHPDPLELTSSSVSFDQKPKKNIWKIFGITIITIAIIIGGIWLVREYLFPQTFTPVVLS
jgi:flagellar biogenesis protein FliO